MMGARRFKTALAVWFFSFCAASRNRKGKIGNLVFGAFLASQQGAFIALIGGTRIRAKIAIVTHLDNDNVVCLVVGEWRVNIVVGSLCKNVVFFVFVMLISLSLFEMRLPSQE